MDLNKARLVASAVRPDDWPDDDLPEIVLAGRSNVGKSSVANLIMARNGLARVGKTPGKTRTINFYEIDGKFRLVDLPGYGYSNAVKGTEDRWSGFVNEYFIKRKQIVLVIHLLDARHSPSELDVLMNRWLNETGMKYVICLTKTDKQSGSERQRAAGALRESLELPPDVRIVRSSKLKGSGRDELTDLIFQALSNKGVKTGRHIR